MTKRADFLKDPDVSGFVLWLSAATETLKVSLNIPSSSKVPRGVEGDFEGLPGVVAAYKWQSTVQVNDNEIEDAQNWQSTRSLLEALGERLKCAIKQGDDDETFGVCQDILQWGGNRNPNVGAQPFLNKLRENRTLANYLEKCQQDLLRLT